MRTRLVAAVGACALVVAATSAVMAIADPAAKCAAAKRRAAGKTMSAQLACLARAKAKSVPTDPDCLAKAGAKFEASFTKAGAACPGTAPAIAVLADSCVSMLDADAPGVGKCPSQSVSAIGASARGVMNCAARDVVRPGAFGVCAANSIAKLTIALDRAGGCATVDAVADVTTCEKLLSAALVAGTTTTTAPLPAVGARPRRD